MSTISKKTIEFAEQIRMDELIKWKDIKQFPEDLELAEELNEYEQQQVEQNYTPLYKRSRFKTRGARDINNLGYLNWLFNKTEELYEVLGDDVWTVESDWESCTSHQQYYYELNRRSSRRIWQLHIDTAMQIARVKYQQYFEGQPHQAVVDLLQTYKHLNKEFDMSKIELYLRDNFIIVNNRLYINTEYGWTSCWSDKSRLLNVISRYHQKTHCSLYEWFGLFVHHYAKLGIIKQISDDQFLRLQNGC